MSEFEYRGPGELTSAIGEGVKGAVGLGAVGAGIGAGAHALATKTEVGVNALKSVAGSDTVHNVVKHASGFSDAVSGRVLGATAVMTNSVKPLSVGATGRAALVTGGVLATIGTVTGMANGWGRASQARKSWVESVEGRSGGQIYR
jgi:hypothetical protein